MVNAFSLSLKQPCITTAKTLYYRQRMDDRQAKKERGIRITAFFLTVKIQKGEVKVELFPITNML